MCVVPRRRHSLSFKRTQKNVSLLLSLKGSNSSSSRRARHRLLNESCSRLGSRQTAAMRCAMMMLWRRRASLLPINSLTHAAIAPPRVALCDAVCYWVCSRARQSHVRAHAPAPLTQFVWRRILIGRERTVLVQQEFIRSKWMLLLCARVKIKYCKRILLHNAEYLCVASTALCSNASAFVFVNSVFCTPSHLMLFEFFLWRVCHGFVP